MTKKSKKPLLDNNIIRIDKYISWLLLLSVAIIPILIRVKIINFVSPLPGIGPATGASTDIYAYYKSCFLILTSSLLLLLLLIKTLFWGYKLRYSLLNPLLILLSVWVMISGFAAEYKSIALWGMIDSCEGVFTLVCYFLLIIIAINIMLENDFFKKLGTALGIVTIINFCLLIPYFYGIHILNSKLIRWLVIPSQLKQYNIAGVLDSTLSNPNYISGLFAALCAYFLTAAFWSTDKWQQGKNVLFGIMTFAIVLASLSSSGFVALLIFLPILVLLLVFIHPKNRSLIITTTTSLIALVAVFFILNAHNPAVYNSSFNIFPNTAVNPKSEVIQESTSLPPSDIGNQNNNTSVNPLNVPAPGLSAGSGRTYIWTKTIELVKSRPCFGYGSDTLAYYFPHNKDKISNLGSYKLLVGKSHNFYLSIAYNSGLPALLLLLGILSLILYKSIIFIFTSSNKHFLDSFIPLFSFLIVYLIQWLFNDSVIGSSVVFWIILGLTANILTVEHSPNSSSQRSKK